MMIERRLYTKFTLLLFVSLLLISCTKDEPEDEQPQDVTRWECILFGSYPANEVVGDKFDAVDGYALVDGDVIKDT